jgi:hypothetical protein
MSKTAKTIHTHQLGAEYLTTKEGEIQPKELKVLRQYVKRVMAPEGLTDFKYYFGTLRHTELSQDLHDKHDRLFDLAMLCIKGIRYEESKALGITYFAKIEYNEGSEEALRPHLNDGNTIPTVLHLLRLNIATRLRYELVKIREADKRHEEERKAIEQKRNQLKISNTLLTSVLPRPITTILNLGDQELPDGVIIEPVKYKNRLGGDINLTGYQHELFLALLELNHKKSDIDPRNPGYYLGNYDNGLEPYEEVIHDTNNKIQRILTPHFTTTYNEIATQLNGGKKPSQGEKEKVTDTLWDLIENAELWPTISFAVGKDKYKLNKALFEIIKHENGTQKDIIVRLNPAVTHDIKKKYFKLPPNFTARRIEISQQLGKNRPEFLMPLVYYITAMKSNNSLKKDEQGRPYWETGLLKIQSGEPGILYRFGYLQAEQQRHQKRFLERWATATQFLKELEIIEEYSERVTTWGYNVGRFTFKAQEKKVGKLAQNDKKK